MITSWNLNWLSDAKPKVKRHSNIPTRRTSDYRAFANIINDISPDVLAFQEVANHQSIKKIISLDKYQVAFSSRQVISNDEIWSQFVGFAIRKGLNYHRHPDLHQLDIWNNQYLRYGVDVTLYQDGKQSLRLLNVHLKSGCYSNRHRNKSCTVLREQFKVLAQWMSQRQAEQQPFIILGDFNRRLAQKGDTYWQGLTSKVSTPAPILMTEGIKSQCRSQAYNKRKRRWEVRQYPGFIDHFIIDGRITEKDTEVSFSEYLFSGQQLKQFQLSDHCPLSISVQL
ncbi:endonuclease/exonuclease/phosphatase family protein [Photobacterium sp. ZSDE20]|uniref:Endonuclease/exonuclease/phosphatase family protein n=1 Tax=Photobacterium pectinilyticum TaxID=2906793 RepID=A0ABT1N3K9_9GAMM|nr:endonuclease/exonuclease/phosphatase family protein [Photobacterium sp. ZSDE20]MCQ1059326.1 endonuclease/exonuclease/phosphatase family protein [Photobacterium sp. ZSDE20]MDD1825585.1 endonuclease/exonuclease/phosphatase family protein [Photobacterium sp. ZSDE20]